MLEVVVALIQDTSGHVLMQQRGPDREFALHWECPGGKVKLGESRTSALRRELIEELVLPGIYIRGDCFLSAYFRPPLMQQEVKLYAYRCQLLPGEVKAKEDQVEVTYVSPYVKFSVTPFTRLMLEHTIIMGQS